MLRRPRFPMVALVFAVALVASIPGPASARTEEVAIEDFNFDPRTTTGPLGLTVH